MSKRVIINADDYGITEGVNLSIKELSEAGVITSTAVMTNMPYYREIVSLKNNIGAGIHLNLTEGAPVSGADKIPSLVNEDGIFFELPQLIKRVKQGLVSKAEASIELDAQTQKLIDTGIQPDHINSHESFLKYPFFVEIVKNIGKTHRIPAVRAFSQRKYDYTRLLSPRKILVSMYLAYQKFEYKRADFKVADRQDSLLKFGQDYQWSCEKLKSILNDIPEGVLEIVVHPGHCDKDTLPLGEYVKEREVEHKVLSNHINEIKNIPGVELIRFEDI